MPRVKRGKTRTKKRRALLSRTKGYKWGSKNLTRRAKEALKKSGAKSYNDRRTKKRTARALWQIKIKAALGEHSLSYSKFINLLKKNKIELNRKVLAEIAEKKPVIFKKIVEQVKK